MHSDETIAASLCNGSVILEAYVDNISQTWFNGYTGNTLTVLSPGTYHLSQFEQTGCTVNTTFEVTDAPLHPFSLGEDINLCNGETRLLEVEDIYVNYFWSTGSTANEISINNPGTYWLSAFDSCGVVYHDTLNVFQNTPTLELSYNGQSTICDTQLPIVLNIPAGFTNPLWNGTDNGNSFSVTEAGIITLTALDQYGCPATDEFVVDNCSNISEDVTILTLQAYPSPATDLLYLECTSALITHLRMIDAAGRIVLEKKITPTNKYELQAENYASGIYTIECQTTQGNIDLRVLISY